MNDAYPTILQQIKEYGLEYALNHIEDLVDLLDHEHPTIRYETAEILQKLSEAFPPAFQNSLLAYENRTGENVRDLINSILKQQKKSLQKKEKEKDITFKDIGGLDELKEVIKESIIYPFQHPELAAEFGIESGGGVLFYGPPGCGKTYVVRAAVGECNVPWISVKISDIVSKWHGETEQNIARVFNEARSKAPSILFIDEIDSLGGRRDMMDKRFEKMEVNQLLTEMDGLNSSNINVLIIAATNAPWEIDPALRRTGRFNKMIYVPPPDYQSRIAVFKVHTRAIPIEDDINYEYLSELTDGFSSADIREICKEAKVKPWKDAMKTGMKRKVNMADFKEVISKRTSSLIPWFRMARTQVERSGEKDLYKELQKSIIEFERVLPHN